MQHPNSRLPMGSLGEIVLREFCFLIGSISFDSAKIPAIGHCDEWAG
jgi:hypothetical protein